MRLDLFLKISRLVKRRTRAQELCGAGSVLVNGIAAKPAKDVKPGDLITLKFSSLVLELKVLGVAASAKKACPEELYQVTSETRIPRERDLWNDPPLSS